MASKENEKMDRPYGWVICLACFILFFVILGSMKSGGVIFVAMLETFDTTRSVAAIIYISTFASLSFTAGVFGRITMQRFGFKGPMLVGSSFVFIGNFSSYFVTEAKYLIITMGIIQGVGFGTIFMPVMSVQSFYFKRYLGIATGIAMAGSGLGSIVLPPLIEFLIRTYGLRGTFLILSGLYSHMFVASMLVLNPETKNNNKINQKLQGIDNKAMDTDLPDPENYSAKNREFPATSISNENNSQDVQIKEEKLVQSKDLKDQENGVTSTESLPIAETQDMGYFRKTAVVLNNRYSIGIVINFGLIRMSILAFSLTIPDFSVSSGYSLEDSSYLISIFSVSDIVSRLVIGVLIDLKCVNLGISYALGLFGQALAFLLIGLFGNISYLMLAVLSGLSGCAYSVNMVHFPVTSTHYLGKRNMSVALSTSALFSVIPVFSIAPL